MFSSTAYEAFYSYIGIYLHEASIKMITSQSVFTAVLSLIVGFSFLFGAWQFAKKSIPGLRGKGNGVSFIFKIIGCFMFGTMLLKVDSQQGVSNYQRNSWHNNKYINTRLPNVNSTYQVSFIFDLLSRSAEEIGKFANEVVDSLFQRTNSQVIAPDAFYRAVMFAGSQSIDDPILKDEVDVYTENCLSKVILMFGQARAEDRVNEFYKKNGLIDNELNNISIQISDDETITCLELKEQVHDDLIDLARSKGETFRYQGMIGEYFYDPQINMVASSSLVNHYLSKTEDSQGLHNGAKVEGALASIFLGINRFFSYDGFLSMLGQGDAVGAALTADRAEKFSEYLQRAPHLKGMVRMGLTVLFPWLIFLVVAGKCRVLISWYLIYLSVMLWTPIWTLLYHLMTSIALSTEVLAEFGRLNDGISLYSSTFITAKLYQFYAIYSWLQLIAGPLPTMILGYSLSMSFLRDSETESAPTIVTETSNVAMSATGLGPVANGIQSISNRRH